MSCRAPRSSIAASRSRLLNRLWHRLEWPPVERLAGAVRRRAVGPSAAPPVARGRPARHRPRPGLSRPSRANARRNPARLSRARARPRPPRRSGGRRIRSTRLAKSSAGLAVPRARMSICPPGVPPWTAREREPATGGCILFLGTLEPRKNLGVLAGRLRAAPRPAGRTLRRSCWPAG